VDAQAPLSQRVPGGGATRLTRASKDWISDRHDAQITPKWRARRAIKNMRPSATESRCSTKMPNLLACAYYNLNKDLNKNVEKTIFTLTCCHHYDRIRT
jgi:hypothetical protein